MSEAIYPTRLRFGSGSGIARFATFGGPISERPNIPGLPEWRAIDYAPGMVSMIQDPDGRWRDLEAKEVALILRWLRHRTRP